MTQGVDAQAQLITQAKRIYLRYAQEVIEAQAFCPWAAEARRRGEVSVNVVLGGAPATCEVVAIAKAIAGDAPIVIALLVFPQFADDAVAFQHFAAKTRVELDGHYPRGACPWAIADFHPRGTFDLTTPERAVAFIRRSPDPTLQLVRQSALSALRRKEGEGTAFIDLESMDLSRLADMEPKPPLHERVAQANLKKLQVSAAEVQETLKDIEQDRILSYGAVPLPTPRW